MLDEHGSLDLEFGTVQWLEPAFRDNEVDLMLDEEGPFDFDYGAIESLDESNKYARAVRPPPTKPSATPSPKPANSIPSKPGNPQKSQPQPPTQVPVNKNNGDDDDRIQCSPDLCPTYCGPSKGSSAATKSQPRNLSKRCFPFPNDKGKFVNELLK